MELLGTVAAIWRYPIKSLQFEALEEVDITPEGLRGDREAALFARAGHPRAGKTYRGKEHNLLHTTREGDRAVAMAAERAADVEIQAESGRRYFDAAPVSILLDRWIGEVEAHVGRSLHPLRWRPNFFVRAQRGATYSEAELVDRDICIGSAVLRVRSPIDRCVTPNYDIASGDADPEVLRYVARGRANVMGIYCDVRRAGAVRRGDALRL